MVRTKGLIAIVLLLGLCCAEAQTPWDSPLYYRARQAFSSAEFDSAASWFRMIVRVNPSDGASWYLLARSEAGRRNADAAREALVSAVSLGSVSIEPLLADTLFLPWHSQPWFVELQQEINAFQQYSPQRHYLPQSRMGWYDVQLPEGYNSEAVNGYPLILYLHGGGRNTNHAETMAEQISPGGCISLYMNAPYADQHVPDQYNILPGRFEDPATMSAAWDMTAGWYTAIVEDAIGKWNIDPERVAIVGFSQGAAAVYIAAMSRPDLFTAVAPLSGWIPAAFQDSVRYLALAENDVQFFISAGDEDAHFTVDRLQSFASSLLDAGVGVSFRVYHGGHELTNELAGELRVWLQRELQIVD